MPFSFKHQLAHPADIAQSLKTLHATAVLQRASFACQKAALCWCSKLSHACRSGSGGQQVDLLLSGDEASDYINFVVKDSSSGTWYDQGGTNYHIPLSGSVATMSIDEQIPDAELPDLPGELCGIWSYIKWEHAGCPNRTEHESQAAYREAIEVTFSFLACSSYLLQVGAVQYDKNCRLLFS